MKPIVLTSLLVFLCIASAFAQEYIYPNRLLSDSGLIEYRPYTLEEARAIERGDNNAPIASPFLLDWGPERMILIDSGFIYSVDLASSHDSLYCLYGCIYSPRIGFTRSIDGGNTWSDSLDLSDTSIVEFNSFPDIVALGDSLIMGFRGQEQGAGENLFYRRSYDGGETWGPMQRVFSAWQQVSNYGSLSNSGRILYFSHINYDRDSLYVVRSTNWGASWNGLGVNVAYLSGTPQPMRIASGGSYVHLVWVNEVVPVSVHYSRSTDRGLTWSPEINISNDSSGAQLPYISVDGSHVAISWMGYKYSPYMFTGDLFIRQSFDNGVSWDSIQVLTNSHYVSRTSVWAKDNILAVGWQDARLGVNTEAFAVFSTDSGNTWNTETRLSYGDEISYAPVMAGAFYTLHALWGDLRLETPGLYYRSNNLLSDAIDEKPPMPEKAAILSAYPNPFNSSVMLSIVDKKDIKIAIYDITGRIVTNLAAENGRAVWDASAFSSGIYFARVRPGNSSTGIKLILLK